MKLVNMCHGSNARKLEDRYTGQNGKQSRFAWIQIGITSVGGEKAEQHYAICPTTIMRGLQHRHNRTE